MLPELQTGQLERIRIPGELDVSVTPRVRNLIDTAAFQRLRNISQLGLVSRVYPGATHSRFEHSLGVYRLSVQVLSHLISIEPEFAQQLNADEAKTFLVAALLHDIGHWPYCHPIEDIGLDWVPQHESLARRFLTEGNLASKIHRDWNLAPENVADFLDTPAALGTPRAVLQNALGGPTDIDKMDYLQRDSLHAGVPYGRNFDIGRLISSQCIGPERTEIAITDKGKTAAEMMVFARYVMFSEVYWHHAVRSATAMLQRLVFELCDAEDCHIWSTLDDAGFASLMLERAVSKNSNRQLAQSLFGDGRELYKRFGQFPFDTHPEVHRELAGKPYDQLLQVAQRLAAWLNQQKPGLDADASEVLLDAPPVKLEVQFKLQVRTRSGDTSQFVPLESISPVVQALATRQFDNYVKRVRVFVSPRVAQSLKLSQDALAAQLLKLTH